MNTQIQSNSIVFSNPIYKELSQLIEKAIHSFTDIRAESISESQIYAQLSLAPNLELGHYSYPCFSLSKTLKKSPAQLADQLKNYFPKNQLIETISNQGPYLNFFIKTPTMGKLVVEAILENKYFELAKTSHYPKTMIEYSQPNTHKVLHVGHMRNLCLGNSLVKMHRYLNHPVIAVTYPGDVGTHVAKTLWYMKYHCSESVPTERKGAWLGELYSKAHIKLEDEKGSALEDKNRAELTIILKQLEQQTGEFYELWKETREWSLELMNEAYSWADVEFDRWFFESEMDGPSLALAKKMQLDGLLIKSEGAIGMDLTAEKLGFCMLIKSDGTGLYATKDVLLAKKKFEEFGIQKNIYIVDNRQAHHFKQVFKVLEKMGFDQAKQSEHLQYDVVELPDGAMSSRKGNIVPLMSLVEMMEQTIKERYLNRYKGDWTSEEIDYTARIVANGAIKYGMIRVDNNRKIVFDMMEWLKLDGETGPYLQYVYARIVSLGNKQGFSQAIHPQWTILKHPQEIALMVKLALFNTIVEHSVEKSKTMHLCSYLYELAKLFNSFYAECPIAKAENIELKNTRLYLTQAVGAVMKEGLELLGIVAPEKM